MLVPIVSLVTQSPQQPRYNVSHGRTVRRLVVSVLVVCGVACLFTLLKESATLSFSVVLDGKPLPKGKTVAVHVDGQPFTSGCTIAPGPHNLAIDIAIAQPYSRRLWVWYGSKDLGELSLRSARGSLSVSVSPSPATITVKRGTEVVGQGSSPLRVEELSLGNYELEITRGEYIERRPVIIEGRQPTEAQIDLNFGGIQLSCDPADADFTLSGNGREWSGRFPSALDEVPVGDYTLSSRRKGWEIRSVVSIRRGHILTNTMVFPYGSLEVTSDPRGLVVFTNSVEIGRAPFILRELRPQVYTLAASDGENRQEAVVAVGEHETTKYAFTFLYGSAEVTSTPTGATVMLKGNDSGKTPLTLERVIAGDTVVDLRLDGYVPTSFPFVVTKGLTTNVKVNLLSFRYLEEMKKAREALKSNRLSDALKSVMIALESAPTDTAATMLRKDVESALQKAAEEKADMEERANAKQREADRLAEAARLEKERIANAPRAITS